MKNKFIGKSKVFTKEQLKEIRGGSEPWETYYEGHECGENGRACRNEADCFPLNCSSCQPYMGGFNQYGGVIVNLRCT